MAAVTLCSQDGERRFKPLAEKTPKGCLQAGLGREGGKGRKRSWAAATWLGTAAPGEVLTGKGEKARSKHLGCSPPKSQPARADALAVGVLRCWGASAARLCPPSRCCEIFTFVLPDIDPSRDESELRGSACFPRVSNATHKDTTASWRGYLVWQNGKRPTFGKQTRSALGGAEVAWHPRDSCGLLPCAHHPHYKHRRYSHCLPTCFLARIFILAHKTCTVYSLWHCTMRRSAALWPALHWLLLLVWVVHRADQEQALAKENL